MEVIILDQNKNKDVGILHDNNVSVNNNLHFNFHLGDSLNLLVLIGGLFAFKIVSKQLKGRPPAKIKRKTVRIK
jgi:hypothetical protein